MHTSNIIQIEHVVFMYLRARTHTHTHRRIKEIRDLGFEKRTRSGIWEDLGGRKIRRKL